mmetsp:Transcript_17274/g.44847  ORF Transcript_17274/g.44847 Transcript_17274/m.44847 type:complete len:242 (-) Transcript_17274:248-973(-)
MRHLDANRADKRRINILHLLRQVLGSVSGVTQERHWCRVDLLLWHLLRQLLGNEEVVVRRGMHTGCRWLPIPLCRRAFVDDARLWREVVPISRDVDLRDEVLRVQGRGRACRWRWARLDLLRIREFFLVQRGVIDHWRGLPFRRHIRLSLIRSLLRRIMSSIRGGRIKRYPAGRWPRQAFGLRDRLLGKLQLVCGGEILLGPWVVDSDFPCLIVPLLGGVLIHHMGLSLVWSLAFIENQGC